MGGGKEAILKPDFEIFRIPYCFPNNVLWMCS